MTAFAGFFLGFNVALLIAGVLTWLGFPMPVDQGIILVVPTMNIALILVTNAIANGGPTT